MDLRHAAASRLLLALSFTAIAACGPPRMPDEGAAPAPGTEAPAASLLAGTVALRADDGHYVTADQADGAARWGALMANRDSIGAWERFEVVPEEGGRIALRASNGRFVSAEREGPRQAVADREAVGEWERFEAVPMDDGRVALRTTEGRYLTAELTEGASCFRCVVADRTQAGPWEAFLVVQLGPQP